MSELDRNILNVRVDCLFDGNNTLKIEQLENNIEVEDMEYKRKRYLKEAEIQKIVIQYLHRKNIICQGSTNGNNASMKTIRFRQQQGQEKGMPDIHIDKWNGKHNSFYLELKTKKGRLKPHQIEKIKQLQAEYIPVSVSYGLYDAIYKIEKYLQGEPIEYEAN